MNSSLLPFLRCPISGNELHLIILEENAVGSIQGGILFSDSGPCYPVMDGVPRLLPDSMLEHEEFLRRNFSGFEESKRKSLALFGNIISGARKKNFRTRKSFTAEWDGHDYESGKTWELDISGQLTRFLRESGESIESLRGKTMLDAGCGNGHLSMELARHGITVFAMDFSESVLQAQRMNRQDNCHFIQGDVEFPPFPRKFFQLIHSSGVLIHTKDTQKSFNTLSDFVSLGGKISIWVYRKRKEKIHRLFNEIRKFTSVLPASIQRPFLRIFIFYPALFWKRCRQNKQRKEELWVEVLDWFTPEFRWEHDVEEVKDWFKAVNFLRIQLSDENHWGFNMTGMRPPGNDVQE